MIITSLLTKPSTKTGSRLFSNVRNAASSSAYASGHPSCGLHVDENENDDAYGSIVVVENVFHYKQVLPLKLGDNVIGRYVKGTAISTPIETVDPSVDTKHCIINVKRDKNGRLVYTLRDAPSNTGTFYMNDILTDYDRVRLEDGSIVTIGATTLILRAAREE